jgi:ADP-heptose:LPS heptosyltransferase
MKTLVYHAGALGDFLSALPAMKAWRHAHPFESVILLGKPAYGELGIHSGSIDEVWDVERLTWAWLFSNDAAIPEEARERLSGITAALLFTEPNAPITPRMKALGVSVRAHPPFPRERVSIYYHHLSSVRDWTYLLDDFGPIVRAPESYATMASAILNGQNNVVAVHPGSGSSMKNWPLKNFIDLVERLQKRGFTALWLLGPAEEGLPVPGGCLVAENRGLPVLVRVLKRCGAFIGNDSGIAHLAAASGCSSVVLFGPSDPLIWKPYGAHVRAVVARHRCPPCHLKPNERECTTNCMRLISVDEVFEAFERLLMK